MASSTAVGNVNDPINLATATDAAQSPNAAVDAEQQRVQNNLAPDDNQQATASPSGVSQAPGIIGSQMAPTMTATSAANPDPYGIQAAKAAEQAIKPVQATGLTGAGTMAIDPTQTSAGLIASMMAKDSPLLQQARTAGLTQAQDRGLANSSMAVTAAQDSAYRAMTPLATNDSQLYADASRTNANNQTQLAGINNQAQFQAARDANLHGYNVADAGLSHAYGQETAGTQQGYMMDQLQAKHQQDLENIAKQGDITKAVAQLNTDSAKAINETSNQYSSLIHASSSAASIWSNTQNQIANIITDKTLDAAGKQKAIDTYLAQSRVALNMIGALAGDVDLGSYMDQLFGGQDVPEGNGRVIGEPGPTMGSIGNGVVQP